MTLISHFFYIFINYFIFLSIILYIDKKLTVVYNLFVT